MARNMTNFSGHPKQKRDRSRGKWKLYLLYMLNSTSNWLLVHCKRRGRCHLCEFTHISFTIQINAIASKPSFSDYKCMYIYITFIYFQKVFCWCTKVQLLFHTRKRFSFHFQGQVETYLGELELELGK